MSKLVVHRADETRVYVESTYNDKDNRIRLMVHGPYENEPTELGHFREVKRELVLVLPADTKLKIVRATESLTDVIGQPVVAASDDTPY